MRTLKFLSALLAAGLASACAAVSGPDLPPRPGYHGHGVYQPTPEEQAFDCTSLAFALNKTIQAITAMPAIAKTQHEAPPPSMLYAVQRVSGAGLPVLEDFKRERARMRALTRLNTQKACPVIDTEAQTKAAADKLAMYRKGGGV
jgi:hypothetical protein